MGGDGLLHEHAGTSRTRVGYGRSTDGGTDDDVTDGHNPVPDADKAIEASLHVQVRDHILLTRRLHHRCVEKPSLTLDISTANVIQPGEPSSGQGQEVNATIEYKSCLLPIHATIRTAPGLCGSDDMIITCI
jgi:hypothetical protein